MKYPRPIIGSASSLILKPKIFAISGPIQNQITVDKIIQIMADGKKIFGMGKKDLNIQRFLEILI